MTGPQFRQLHGDPATWTDDEYEAYFAITTDQTPIRDCWFCSAPNPATASRCGFCSHHAADAPTDHTTAA